MEDRRVTNLSTFAGVVSTAVVRSLIAAARKNGSQRVIGVRAEPSPESERRFSDAGEQVHVLPCISSLSIRDALHRRVEGEWLIILTDRPEDDLGAGILGHFANQRLQAPGAWDALKERFAADRVDRALATLKNRLAIAQGMLRITPDDGWPAAPGAVLGIDHAFGAVASRLLAMPSGPMDALSVLDWCTRPDATERLAELREFGGTELADAVVSWISERSGQAGLPLLNLLGAGRTAEVLPLGIALHVLTSTPAHEVQDRQLTELALARLEHLWSGSGDPVTASMLAALGQAARSVVEARLDDATRWQEGRSALHAAERLLGNIQASSLGRDSLVMPIGLTAALQRLAEVLRAFPEVSLDSIENTWVTVETHRLAYPLRGNDPDPRVKPFHAAVRLARWLQTEDTMPRGFADAVRLHASTDAWVDLAYNDASAGVTDTLLGEGLSKVLQLTEERRRAHDRNFAKLLAISTTIDEGRANGFLDGPGDRVWQLERLLGAVVAPLARDAGTLLLVLDGMSAATAAELSSTILHGSEGWTEIIPEPSQRRGAAVAVLPTLTTLSRASLFTGGLTSGGQNIESAGFEALTKSTGINRAALFHKAPLDTSRPGLALQDDIATVISDPQTELVACVLNTVDDSLDKSDPAGITWTPETIRHLRPLLSAAMAAGRSVVMTSDHGHIVERRRGELRTFVDTSSARSRAVNGTISEDEVLVQGRRVLSEGGCAVLAVNETLRYGPVKAGYHGGASPAEVVVPIVVMVPGTSLPAGWKEAPIQEPLWWSIGGMSKAPVRKFIGSGFTAPAAGNTSSLFENFAENEIEERLVGSVVTASRTYKAQKGIAGRVAVADIQVGALLDALVSAPATRLTKEAAATVLQVPPTRMSGAVAQLQKLLNVEGYGVLRVDGAFLILDAALLAEQFGVNVNG